MVSEEYLKNELEDFRKNYSNKRLKEFIENNNFLYTYCLRMAKKFEKYLKSDTDTVKLYFDHFSHDFYSICKPLNRERTPKEKEIIDDIKSNCLPIYWYFIKGIDEESSNKFEKDKHKDLKKSACDMGSLEHRIKMINHLIKFGLCCDNIVETNEQNKQKTCVLRYFKETNTFTLDSKEFALTPSEKFALKEICKPVNQRGQIVSRDVNRINTRSKKIIDQYLIERKRKGEHYKFEKNIEYKD